MHTYVLLLQFEGNQIYMCICNCSYNYILMYRNSDCSSRRVETKYELQSMKNKSKRRETETDTETEQQQFCFTEQPHRAKHIQHEQKHISIV